MTYLPRGQVKIQFANKTNQAKLHIPAHIAKLITPGTLFQVELTEEGILFRYISGQEPPKVPALPGWVQSG